MSVDKLSDCSRTILQQNPFTQICNEVILWIKDNDAFRVYAYLQSKSQEWKVIREDVKKRCGVGYRKLDQIFSYLKRSKLIQYVSHTDEQGKFVKTDIQVLNGLEFDQNVPFLNPKSPDSPLPSNDSGVNSEQSTPALSAPAVLRTCGKETLLNKEVTKEIETKKRESRRKRRTILSDEFFPNEINLGLCREKRIDEKRLLDKFTAHYRGTGSLAADWQEMFKKWVLSEREGVSKVLTFEKQVSRRSENITYGGMRDFTQERLEKEQSFKLGQR